MSSLNEPILTAIKPETIIDYVLAPRDMPKDTHKIWRGKVLRRENNRILVESLEPGYRHLTEHISYNQIIAVEK
jgi:hypothetical protein